MRNHPFLKVLLDQLVRPIETVFVLRRQVLWQRPTQRHDLRPSRRSLNPRLVIAARRRALRLQKLKEFSEARSLVRAFRAGHADSHPRSGDQCAARCRPAGASRPSVKQIVDIDTNIVVVEREVRRAGELEIVGRGFFSQLTSRRSQTAAAQISATSPEEIPGNLLDLERSDRAAIPAIDPLTAANGSGDRPRTSE